MLGAIKKYLSVTLVLATMPSPGWAGGFYRPDEYLDNQAFSFAEQEAIIQQLDREARRLAQVLGQNPPSFANLSCFKDLRKGGSKNFPRINLVYEMHGTERSKVTMHKSMVDAIQGNSLLLLESDIGQEDYALRRTLSKYNLAGEEPKNIRGLDANAQYRTIWFLKIFAHDLNEAQKLSGSRSAPEDKWKEVQLAFVDELTRNPDLRHILSDVAKSGKDAAATTAGTLLHAANTLRSLPPHIEAKIALRGDKTTPQIFSTLLSKASEIAFKKASGEFAKQTDQLKSVTSLKSARDALLAKHIGFNKRDEVFVDQIGKSFCEAIEKKIDTINVIIGAGHRNNIKRRLEIAFLGIGIAHPDLEQIDAEIAETPSPKGQPPLIHFRSLVRRSRPSFESLLGELDRGRPPAASAPAR